MTKEQFFMELEECLQGEVSACELSDSMTYYKQYFDEQIQLGKGEEEVIRGLGSPRLIARSIIDAHSANEDRSPEAKGKYGNAGYGGSGYRRNPDGFAGYDNDYEREEAKISWLDRVGKKAVSIGVTVIVLLLVFLLVRALLPIAILLFAIWLIVQLFRK